MTKLLIAFSVIALLIGNEVISLAVILAWMVKFLIWFCGEASKGF